MNRYLDFNDAGGPGSLGHPNDMAPGILALGEAIGADGRAVLEAMYIAYEINLAISRGPAMRDRGWDQGLQCAMGAAAGMARLLGLTKEQTACALSIAATPSIPLRVTRTGSLSHWKGFATAHSVKCATFAVQLAQEGMTGPMDLFEGPCGLFEQVTGEFDIQIAQSSDSAPERTSLKFYPAEANTITAIETIRRLRDKFDIDQVEKIEIFTYYLSWHEAGGGQGDRDHKWNPKSRESADHSLPYVAAVALVDGTVSLASFEDDRRNDPRVRAVMQKISVTEDPELSRRATGYAGERPMRVRITLEGGRTFEDEQKFARGHASNQMSDAEVEAKFDKLVERVLQEPDHRELKQNLWHLEELRNLDEVTCYFRKFSNRG